MEKAELEPPTERETASGGSLKKLSVKTSPWVIFTILKNASKMILNLFIST
jgi:hypothetical protein